MQSQIAILSGKKTRTPPEQATLQKLFTEQEKILKSGKIIPTVPGQNTQGLTFVSCLFDIPLCFKRKLSSLFFM